MSKNSNRVTANASLGVLVWAIAWSPAWAQSEAPKGKEGVAAYVGEAAITTQELDAKALATDMKLAQSLYNARRAVLDQVIMEKVLGPEAKTRGLTVDQLIRERTDALVKPVTPAEIEEYFKANTARMAGKTLEQVSGQIDTQLKTQRAKEAKAALLTQLKEKAGVRITLEPPRAEVAIAANDPMKGPAGAKITIVEFSEFQ